MCDVPRRLFIARSAHPAAAMALAGAVAGSSWAATDVIYSTLIGGNSADVVYDLGVDGQGNVIVTGYSASSDFPQAPESVNGFWDMIVAKVNASGTELIYSHYILATTSGTPVTEYGTGVAADAAGNAYLTGRTTATDFPTQNALQRDNAGGSETVVMKLDQAGEVIFSTYLGGSGEENLGTPSSERLGEIVVDDDGFIYVAGNTRSPDFPLVNPIDSQITGNFCAGLCSDLFLVKLTPDGQSIVFSTYLGGDGPDDSIAMKLGPDGSIYLLSHRGVSDIRKVAPDGSRVIWQFTLPNGSDGGSVIANAIDVDADGRVYIGGETSTFEFPTTPGVWQEEHGGSFDGHTWQGFVAVLNPEGTAIERATYLGLPTDNEAVTALGVDSHGNAILGVTQSDHFGSVTVTQHLWKFDAALADRLEFMTTGGSGDMVGMIVDDENNIHYAGWAWSGSVSTLTPGAFQTEPAGNIDAYVTFMGMQDPPGPDQTHADLNNDGNVNAADLALLLGAWGACADPGDCAADLNTDGLVNAADLALLLGDWG